MTVPGLLGDTKARDYSRKLRLFNSFAAPELRASLASLGLQPGQRVLDAGCGTGEGLGWLHDSVGRDGLVVGIDLAAAHTEAARGSAPPGAAVLQADLLKAPFADGSFDLIWSVNTIHHLHDPLRGVQRLASLLRRGGRIVLAQSSLLPDMYFPWDSRLERLTQEAVRQYYRDRYRVSEGELAAIRAVVGLLRRTMRCSVTVRTIMIERVSPVSRADEAYLVEAIFKGTWGERLRPYLSAEDYDELSQLIDPQHPRFALRRPDFHFLQSLTLTVGEFP